MTENNTLFTRVTAWVGLCSVLLSTLLMPATAQAQGSLPSVTTSGLQVESSNGALQLKWQGGAQAASTGEASVAATSYGGYLLPLQTMLVEVSGDQPADALVAAAAVQGMGSVPFTGELLPAPQLLPPALDWEPTPLNQPLVEQRIPTSPLFVIGEGMQRGRRLVTLGFSPIYQDPNTGELRSVESFEATVSGAALYAGNDVTADPQTDSRFAPVSALANAPAPTNPLANSRAVKLFVETAGLQQLSGAELSAAGLVSPEASKLHLFYQGAAVPLHIIDGNSDNVLNSGDYLRFYAPVAGDAWNREGVYWLVVGNSDGPRMASRSVTAATAATRNTAHEVGRVAGDKVYLSELAGGDGDNWFNANLLARNEADSFDVEFRHQLPLNNSLPTILDLHVTPYVGTYGDDLAHRLKFDTSGYSVTDSLNVTFDQNAAFVNTTHTVTLQKAAEQWSITLLQEANTRAMMIDAIDYLLPVGLDFRNKGAIFQGVEGTWRYQLSNTPTDVAGGRGLYDITDPSNPQRLTIPAGANFDIQDDIQAGDTAHRYLLTGTGTIATPRVAAHAPVNLAAKSAAHTVYIAPQEFHSALQPLIDLRKSQGYEAKIVDVQAIYDAWSFGMVDPKAIRSFLRYAVGTWTTAPIAAVLVGDATYDPLDNLGYNNPNPVPPYVANVDRFEKYVPCDSCYGQLDGDDPTTESNFLVDIWIGRFSVITSAELGIVVDKLVRYETDKAANPLWRKTSLQITDDDVQPNGNMDRAISCPEDEESRCYTFTKSAEASVESMPEGIRHLRNYYLAATNFSNVTNRLMSFLEALQMWFTNDPDYALQRSISMMNSGVGIVTYTGHANHWTWAYTVEDNSKWLFGLWDVRQLTNRDTPFINLSMTCYTSQFHIPATNHFTIDEHLFLHPNGGAIASWGPTGLSLVQDHDVLQHGFHEALWNAPPQRAKLGALTEAGYRAMVASGGALDVNKAFVLLGDPLTAARVTPDTNAIFMPKLSH